MWDYSEKVMEHYRNPRNVGEIDNADAVGEAGSLACGDMLKLFLKVDEKGIITDAKFQTFGCGSAVASSSVLTEMVIGKHIDEAKKITNKQIADELGGLPPEKMHCSVMGHEALEAAIANYYGEEVRMCGEEKIVCTCAFLSENELKKQIKEKNLTSIEDVVNETGAGGGCGRCHGAINKLLSDSNKPTVEIAAMSKTQQIIKINNVIERFIADELRKDGGDIELVDVEGTKVYVKLRGACASCKNAIVTLKYFVENTLRDHISPDIEVIEV